MRHVTIKEAVRRGSLTVTVPVTIIILVGMISSRWFSYVFYCDYFPEPPLGWLYWSFAITKWKLWAYANVDDLVSLKKVAVTAYLIWPDGGVFNKTEFKTSTEALEEERLLTEAGAADVDSQSGFLLSKTGMVVTVILVLLIALAITLCSRGR